MQFVPMDSEIKLRQEAINKAGDDVGLFGIPFEDYDYHHESLAVRPIFDQAPGDDAWVLDINRQITWYAIIPMSVIGVVLNAFIVCIWSLKKEFRALIFYFKSLAVVDAIYIITFNMWWYSPLSNTYQFVMKGFAFGMQYLAANTTLLLAICHWLSIHRPFEWNAWFSPYRTKLSLCFVIAYCATTKFIERVIGWNDDGLLDTIVSVTVAQVLMTLPLMIEAVMTVGFVRSLLSLGQVAPDISISSSFQRVTCHPATDPPPNGAHRSSFSGGAPFNGQTLSHYSRRKARAITFTILSIICMTFIAYPIGVVIVSYYKLSPDDVDKATKRITVAVINLLHVINSSINFFFYFGYISSFRRMVRQCLCDNFLVGYKSVVDDSTKPIPNLTSYTSGGEAIRRVSVRESIPIAHVTGGFQTTESGKPALVYLVQVADNSRGLDDERKSDFFSTDDETSSPPREMDIL